MRSISWASKSRGLISSQDSSFSMYSDTRRLQGDFELGDRNYPRRQPGEYRVHGAREPTHPRLGLAYACFALSESPFPMRGAPMAASLPPSATRSTAPIILVGARRSLHVGDPGCRVPLRFRRSPYPNYLGPPNRRTLETLAAQSIALTGRSPCHETASLVTHRRCG